LPMSILVMGSSPLLMSAAASRPWRRLRSAGPRPR
jgi:hypothetical protein